MFRRKLLFIVLFFFLAMQAALAQQPTPEHQHEHSAHSSSTTMLDMQGMDMSAHEHSTDASENELAFSSGTSWSPLSKPEYMWMTHYRDWQLMAHGAAFITFNNQGGPRGSGKLESMNWLMLMQERKVGRGTLQFRQMLSAEPLTSPHPGFPELFQTGESYRGVPLVDHQHPHDLFGEISARYVLPIGDRFAWTIYGGPAGEPALGPVTFLHRAAGSDIPSAPLGHHLQDSTHISYGVITTGLVAGKIKVEGSAFNGREPDERRYDLDLGALDSFSGRLNFSPTNNWTMQYSYGHLRKPEALESTNVNRQTASIEYNRPTENGNWANALVWGRNEKTSEKASQNSYLLESTLNWATRNYGYTRMELVDKDELFNVPSHPNFRIGAYTFGGMRDVVQNSWMQLALGADVTFYSKPVALNPVYGDNPVSFRIFIRARPAMMQHSH